MRGEAVVVVIGGGVFMENREVGRVREWGSWVLKCLRWQRMMIVEICWEEVKRSSVNRSIITHQLCVCVCVCVCVCSQVLRCPVTLYVNTHAFHSVCVCVCVCVMHFTMWSHLWCQHSLFWTLWSFCNTAFY